MGLTDSDVDATEPTSSLTPEQRTLLVELNPHLDPEALMAAPVTVAIGKAPPGPTPKGCVLGDDGIIRSAPGVFEQRYRREVQRRARFDRRYQREARAYARHLPHAVNRPVRQTRATRRVIHGRGHAAHGPPREQDDPDPPDVDAARRL